MRRFATLDDLDRHQCTIEEREEIGEPTQARQEWGWKHELGLEITAEQFLRLTHPSSILRPQDLGSLMYDL